MKKDQDIIALLPMKAKSERVPNKNIRLFAGKPLFYHILEKLATIKIISHIIINTDSQKIAELTSRFPKVVIHERPEAIRGGNVPMNTIIDYDLAHCDGEFFLQTHSTNPLVSPESFIKAIRLFFANMPRYDSLFGVTTLQQRMYDKNFKPINHNSRILQNTQDLDVVYLENSCVYLFSRKSFSHDKNRIGQTPYAFVMKQLESYDIDTEDDFLMAEKIFLSSKQGDTTDA